MVLSTCFEGVVSSRMMSVVRIGELLYFQTCRNFRKYGQIAANPACALCIDNMQIEGVCENIGRPADHPDFMACYRQCFPSSFSMYSLLEDERLFCFTPSLVERYVYQNGSPFLEVLDFNDGSYMLHECAVCTVVP